MILQNCIIIRNRVPETVDCGEPISIIVQAFMVTKWSIGMVIYARKYKTYAGSGDGFYNDI